MRTQWTTSLPAPEVGDCNEIYMRNVSMLASLRTQRRVVWYMSESVFAVGLEMRLGDPLMLGLVRRQPIILAKYVEL